MRDYFNLAREGFPKELTFELKSEGQVGLSQVRGGEVSKQREQHV